MESLVEDVDALVAPDLSTVTDDWCTNCQMLRKEIQRLQEEQGQNFGKLKQKIISTDLLIKKYKSKCEDYDLLYKKMEEVNKKSEKQMRQSSILETQLKAALLDVEPLRKRKTALETEVKEQATKIQDLTDKVVAFEGTQRQYEYLTKTSSADIEKLETEKKELLSKIKVLEAGKVTKEAAKEFKVEISSLKKENQVLAKSEKKLDKKLKSSLLKIESLTQALRDAKSSPIRGRKRRSSNSQMSPIKSPLRSPIRPNSQLSPLKSSLKRTPKGRGISPKPSPSLARRAMTMAVREIPVTDTAVDGTDSDSSDVSQGSEYSMTWTFSPLAKCLSPLPPSPACFSNRKEPESDDDMFSEIADELEQQLAEGFDDCHESHDEMEDSVKSPPITEPFKQEEKEIIVKEEEVDEGADLFDLNDYENVDNKNEASNIEVSDEKPEASIVRSEKETEETTAALLDKGEADNYISKHFETISEPHPETDLDSEKLNNSYKLEDGLKGKEDNNAEKKRIAHLPKCHDKNQSLKTNHSKTDVVEDKQVVSHTKKSSASKESSDGEDGMVEGRNKESETETHTLEEKDEKSKQLPRADTSEFVPVLDGNTETLSESDTETETHGESNNIPDCKGDASAVDKKQDDAYEDSDPTGVVELEVEVEEQVEEVERQFLPPRGMLRRQSNVSCRTQSWKSTECLPNTDRKINTMKASGSVYSSHISKKGKKGKLKNGPLNFIAFKKSSSGTLAEELSNLSTDVDYVCNDRREVTTNKGENILNKNDFDISKVKVKKKSTYKDLDDIHDDFKPDFCTEHERSENKKTPSPEKKLSEGNVKKETVVPDCDKNVNAKDLTEMESNVGEKSDVHDTSKLTQKCRGEDAFKQPSQRVVRNRTKSAESCETERKVLRSHKRSLSDGNNSPILDLVKHKNRSDICVDKMQETTDSNCDIDMDDTHEEIKESVPNSSDIDTEKVQTSRQLSTGFTVNSSYSDRLSESPSPNRFLEREKYDKRKSKMKVSSLCDTVLEQIKEEDSQKDSQEDDVTSVDDYTAHLTKITDEINKPGCSFHYNENEENSDDLSSSLSLSEEIERIMDKKSVQKASRVISCTPDMLDTEMGETLESVSRTESPLGDSIGRKTPLSPLPISPFEFIIPISPLPPSPVRDIDRVSPLSPDSFDANVADTEYEQNDSESPTDSKEAVSNVLKKPTFVHTTVEELKFSVPDALSPIKTPEQNKCNSKLKKSKSSAFEKVLNVIDKQSVDTSNIEKVQNLEEKTPDENHSKCNTEKCEKVKAVTEFGAHKQKQKLNDMKESVVRELNMDPFSGSSKTYAPSETEPNIQNDSELKKEFPSNDGVQNSTIVEKENQTQNVVTTKTNLIKEETKVDSLETDLLDIPTGHENLVAVKKKARMAHKPNIQALKPQKIQVIEATSLPMPHIGRKRRSLEPADKEAQEKKQCKGPHFQKQKPLNKTTTLSKEETRRMQTFLKSQESPDSFVTNVTETDKQDSVISRLVDSCLECLGRIRTDTTEVVHQQCVANAHLSLQHHWPFLSDVEKQATKLLKYLYSHQHLNVSSQDIMCRLWEWIFGRNISVNVVGQMCFCRVFTALCSLEGDVEQARVLFYHIVTCGHLNVRQFVVPVVSVWPEVLRKSEFDRPDKTFTHGLLLVLEEVVTRTLMSEELEINKKVLVILQNLCGWRGSSGDTEAILRTLLQRLAECSAQNRTARDTAFELVKAVHLLSVFGGWPWFKEYFIRRHGLQPHTNKYLARSPNKPVSPICMNAILQITGSVTQALSTTVPVRDIEQFTRTWMLPVINRKEADPEISKCCVEVLLELSTLQPKLLKGVHSWFLTQPATVQDEFRGKLEAIRKQYQSKQGFICESFL